MPNIQHPAIVPRPGDPTSGPHILNYYTFASPADMAALNDVNFGVVVLAPADVGRVARVGAGTPYRFFVLADDATPVWLEFGGDPSAVADGRDDFTEGLGSWTTALISGATIDTVAGAPFAGYGGPGLGNLKVTDAVAPNSKVTAIRTATGFWAETAPTLTARVIYDPVVTNGDDRRDMLFGFRDVADLNYVVWYSAWNGATLDHYLGYVIAGVPNLGTTFVLPALGAAKAYQVRLSMSTTGAVLEIAPDGLPLQIVKSRILAPGAALYQPLLHLVNVAIPAAQERLLFFDYVTWQSRRYV